MAAYKPIRIGDSVPLQQINPSTETIDGKIQVTQTGVVLGRSSAGAGAHEEILFADLPGGGGGASYTEITYADMATALAGGTLTPGGWYLITDAAGTDLGFLTYAVKENEISPAGVGGYLNADFQAVGDYSGVEAITGQAAGTQLGIWRTSFEAVTINYLNLAGGTFAVGDTITGGTTSATAVILTDDGVSIMTAYMTSAGVAFDGSEVLDNGNGVTADMDGAASAPAIAQGDIVIWNLLHWQLTDITQLYGANPEANTLAYTQLLKTDTDQGYITAWDVSEFNFSNNSLEYRKDFRGNIVYKNISVLFFPFGSNTIRDNFVLGGQISPNCIGQTSRNTVYQGASISNNGPGDVTECILYANSQISVTSSEDSEVTGCTLYQSATITEISIGQESLIEYNILENGAQLTDITAGANCSISRNKIGQGATLGGSTTMGDGADVSQNNILSGSVSGTIGNASFLSENTLYGSIDISLGENAAFSANNIFGALSPISIPDNDYFGVNVLNAGGLISNITSGFSAKEVGPLGSTIVKYLDITGLTTIDLLEENFYIGRFYLTSDNATETINQIDNPIYRFGFIIGPAAGLVLTITGTAYAGIAAGQIALKAASYALDGDKGEYIVLEIDPLGTGALIEKQVVNGLI